MLGVTPNGVRVKSGATLARMEMLFGPVLQQALGRGLIGIAVVDRYGTTVDIAGDITEEEAMPLAAFVMFQLKAPDLAERLFAGDVLKLELDGREIALAIAKKQLFVVAVMATGTDDGPERLDAVRNRIATLLAGAERGERLDTIPPWGTGGGTGGAGPGELPVVEWGVTVGRDRGKA